MPGRIRNRDGVSRCGQGGHYPGARSADDARRRVDGEAVAEHAVGKYRVRTVSRAVHQPSNGARFVSGTLLSDLYPIERPQGVKMRPRETQAHIVSTRERRQFTRRQRRDGAARWPRGQPQDRNRCRIAAVDMNFELAQCGSRIPHTDLGGISAEFIIERQRDHRRSDSRSVLQVDVAIDPARVHDIDGERRLTFLLRSGRFEQKADAIAAQFELVAAATRSGVLIDTPSPRA